MLASDSTFATLSLICYNNQYQIFFIKNKVVLNNFATVVPHASIRVYSGRLLDGSLLQLQPWRVHLLFLAICFLFSMLGKAGYDELTSEPSTLLTKFRHFQCSLHRIDMLMRSLGTHRSLRVHSAVQRSRVLATMKVQVSYKY